MPRTKTAKKALRQNIKHRQVNIQRKKNLKTAIKDFKKTLVGDQKEAPSKLSLAYQKLDKMAKVGFIKKGKADRIKSRLAKKLVIK